MIDKPTLNSPIKAKNEEMIDEINGLNDELGSLEPKILKNTTRTPMGLGTGLNPNTTTEPIIVTNHANSPLTGGSNYWYVQTFFYADTGNKVQVAYGYTTGLNGRIYSRNLFNNTWGSWVEK